MPANCRISTLNRAQSIEKTPPPPDSIRSVKTKVHKCRSRGYRRARERFRARTMIVMKQVELSALQMCAEQGVDLHKLAYFRRHPFAVRALKAQKKTKFP